MLDSARRVAELPYDRVSRALVDMEAAATQEKKDNEVATLDLAGDIEKRKELGIARAKSAISLQKLETKLTNLQEHKPSLIERLTGSHAAVIRAMEAERDREKEANTELKTKYDQKTGWIDLQERIHAKHVAEAAPRIKNAERNLKIVAEAREMLRTRPRWAALGPFGFIQEAAMRAGFKTPADYSLAEEKEKPLPTGDLRHRVNMWGIPLDFG